MRDRKEVGPEVSGSGEDLGGVKIGKSIIRIYCLRKQSIFNKRKNKLYKNKTSSTVSMVHKSLWTL